jgi:hypothetical protein
MAPPTSTLPSSHPLIAELTSLRQQLSQYQKSGHQSAIQLQGAKLELNLAKDEQAHLREANESLRSELQILRYVLSTVELTPGHIHCRLLNLLLRQR